MERESRLVIVRGWGMGADRYQTALGDHDNVMKLHGGMDELLCGLTENHYIVFLKSVNFLTCTLYF